MRKRGDEEETKEDQESDKLLSAYPNPADKSVTFQYYLETESAVTLKIFDLAGRVVATVADESQSKGPHEVKYEISNFEAGVYFYTLKTVLGKETKGLVIVR
ncbi:MAG: T9SS type A sorting domain-containing protein [Flammeovirgaceae bacterium]|nr:T9SS type A sorting domain-containing protein [Flammeovirgaceae bacterium]